MKFGSKISVDKSWKFTPRVLILIIFGVVILLVISAIIYQLTKTPPPEAPPPPKEKTMEEILKDLSVPEEKRGAVKGPSPEILESLTPPSGKEAPPVPEEILKELTPQK